MTAKHVAESLKDRIPYFLVNKMGGGVMPMRSYGDKWWLHPSDKTADVAVIPCSLTSDMDCKAVFVDQFATTEEISGRHIGIGDEIFATGLFTPAPGITRNMPILRHGNISMLPEEQIQTELGFADVYLVEALASG